MRISIIIAVYNKSKYLDELFGDLINQTFTDYECILVDDGSQDNSGIICDDMSKKDSRFRTFHLKNCGVSNARNFGISQAEGEYITFIDSDDRLCPEYLSNLFRCINENKVDLVISGLEKYWLDSDRKEFVRPLCFGKKDKKNIINLFAQMQKDTGIFGFCVAKIFRRELISDIRFDSTLTLAEDFDFYLRLYKKVHSFYFDDKCYYRYLQTAENSSAAMADEQIDYMSQLFINLRYKNFLIEENAYEGNNKIIIDEKINNYIYYVIFYSSNEELPARLNKLRELVDYNTIELKGNGFFQNWILFIFKIKQYRLIKMTLDLYRSLRKIIHKIK